MGTKIPQKRSTLDTIFVPSHWAHLLNKAYHLTAVATDQKAVVLKLRAEGYIKRGPGLWKLNTQILEEPAFERQPASQPAFNGKLLNV